MKAEGDGARAMFRAIKQNKFTAGAVRVRVRPPASVAANADSIEIIIIAPELINYDVLHDGKVQRFQDTMNADVQRRLWRETMM